MSLTKHINYISSTLNTTFISHRFLATKNSKIKSSDTSKNLEKNVIKYNIHAKTNMHLRLDDVFANI